MAVAMSSRRSSGPNTALHEWNLVTQSLCIIFMTFFFALRVYTRKFILNCFGKEDWMCAGAWFLGTSYSIIALLMGHYGGGLHQSEVSASELISFDKTVYVTMVMYGPTAFLTKLSLLWIMIRVFSPYRKAVKFIYILLVIMLGYYIPAVIVKIRICLPISKFWDSSVEGSCLDETSIILADAVMSTVTDLTILLLPLPLTLSLQMSARKKMRVMGLLGAGGLACAASIIRLVLIILTSSSKDGTYAFMRINMFGNAEVAIGVICACLPALSALLSRVLHEYSSNKETRPSGYEMSRNKHQRGTDSKSHHSRLPTTVGNESDQDVLMHHPQGDPRIETSIQGDRSPRGQGFAELGIMKTVDVSTSVETMR
ncbi:hypothetical protein ASPZODRAFT_149948 [Penicilliopsis zonata CBS 506.65]|uniref:Rhodopsin domain-containing protein n=1 Tax=Penicilliopsis zonata CBS 506.65 TaxID=1073090 RepID=A0A1L9SPD0_9EURO|nr:hypothetical protein ASPZODRAFT_149948 [Penicilliopsis zonata CBS 506.65]OJJ48976.1 hypothetical protein ASPZODRAFT_149948 [Penicilliopsis zonata CBS 506.65]